MQTTSLTVATVPRFAKRRKRRMKKARGFSLGELSKARLQASQARSLKIRIDHRRSTVHAQNVLALKAFLEESEPKTGVSQPSVETVTEGSERERDSAQAEKKSRRRRGSPAEKQPS